MTKDDLISRQAVTDTVRKIILGFFSEDGAMTDTEKTLLRVNKAICNGVRELPSAQQETAKRIVGKSKDGMTLWYQCDMCNEPVDAQDNFCRGCGRRLTDG